MNLSQYIKLIAAQADEAKKIYEAEKKKRLKDKNKESLNSDEHVTEAQTLKFKDFSKLVKKPLDSNLNLDLPHDNYQVWGSYGQGAWAQILWIAIADVEITATTQDGLYIVFLFTPDFKKVALSLNLGWTAFKEFYGMSEGLSEITKFSNTLLSELLVANTIDDFSTRLSLWEGDLNDLAKGYEAGSIIHRLYEINSLDDEELNKDFIKSLNFLSQLKEYYLNHKPIKSTKLVENNAYVIEKLPNVSTSDKTKNKKRSRKPVKIDYVELLKEKSELGLAGELFVMRQEKEKLENLKKNKEVQNYLKVNDLEGIKVSHVSLKDDSKGYDIQSYKWNESIKKIEKIYIEVKTTKKNDPAYPFYISKNEREVAEKLKDNYWIYRLYNFNNQEEVEYWSRRGTLDTFLNLEEIISINYKAYVK